MAGSAPASLSTFTPFLLRPRRRRAAAMMRRRQLVERLRARRPRLEERLAVRGTSLSLLS